MSTPKRIATFCRFRRSASAGSARRGSRCASWRKEQRAAEAAGEVGLERADAGLVEPFVIPGALGKARQFRRIARQRHDQAAVAHRAGEASRPPVDRRRAQGSAPPPRSMRARTTAPACRRPSTSRRRRPARWPRSITSTAKPRSLSSSAVERPATPAPTTVTFDGLNALLPFLRRHDPDQVQRVQPHRLSQTGSCGNRTPLGRRQNKLPTAPAVKRPAVARR